MMRLPFIGAGLVAAFCLHATSLRSQEVAGPSDNAPVHGLDYYAQGGVVVDGVAYFTANDSSRRPGVTRTKDFPCVVAVDVESLQQIRAYDFEFTYDSSPLVVQKKDGTWLVVAHEHQQSRTVALQRDTGQVEWRSAANQPGNYFFGYSFYRCRDDTTLLLMACRNGLHALSAETGEDVWWVQRASTGGVTPCVDQRAGLIYYQCNGKLVKIRAADGQVIKEVDVTPPNVCISWNTVLIDDEHGAYVATRWYGRPEWDSAVRVYDRDLTLRWERTGLPHGKKDTLTYADGKLVCGSGNGWSKKYTGNEWKYLAAYAVDSGDVLWKCDLSDYEYAGILNAPYFNGCFFAESSTSPPKRSFCFRVDASTGELKEVYDYGRAVTSCATHIIASGKILSGDLWEDRIVVTRIADHTRTEWPGPFGDPQTNQMAASVATGVEFVAMEEIGRTVAPGTESRLHLPPGTRVAAQSRIRDMQADAGRITDGDRETWWSSGAGDLAIDPIDVDVQFERPCTLAEVVLITSTLKGQLRLKDFDLYAGMNGAWDGAHPLAMVRDNTEKVIRVDFPPVRLERMRIRMLGSARPDNAFAHIAELGVVESDDQPQRTVQSSPFPPTPATVGHDMEAIRRMIAILEPNVSSSRIAAARVHSLETRLRLMDESRLYEAMLERITKETETHRQLDAPAWAVAQRDCMARLRVWTYYWIDHQQADGQFGGSYEDDVELTCGWPVLVLAQDDAKVRRSLQLLGDGVWHSRPFLEQFGYDRLTDVEHAAENTSYSQPRMVVLDHENPLWSGRCRRTASTLAEFFLAKNDRGLWQFPSDFFGFDPKTLKPVTRRDERPFDIPQSSKALKPAMYAVWSTGDAESRRLMLDYGRTWLAAAHDPKGPDRIAGLIPEKVLWPSGQAVGTHAHLASMRATLFHLIGCYYVSGEKEFLEPIRVLLENTVDQWAVNGIPSAGSLDRINDEDLTGLLEQLALVAILYRQAAGDEQFDVSFARWCSRVRDALVDGRKSYVLLDRNSKGLWHLDRPLSSGAYLESRCSVGAQLYLGWLVTGDEDYLAKLGWNLSSCLNDKWGAFSYWFYDKMERRVTSNDHLAHKIQNSESALSLMYLGGPGTVEAVWPQLAVSWKGVNENFCALVHRNDGRGLLVELYSFDLRPRKVTANLWELDAGAYEAHVLPASGESAGEAVQPIRFEVAPAAERRRPTELTFELDARTTTRLEIRSVH